ncbi:MAG: hypothetical protein AB8B65_04435 [Kordia sp.]|uniref:hypothetical protein n=1 Tax=Kordia sp. TaxID=1965332 RepID=UPI0038598D03
MMKRLILILIFITGFIVPAQNKSVKKSELKRIFRKSIDQESRRRVSTLSNPWVINNTDSLYFKADTIKLINIKKKYKLPFCKKINWSFFRKDKFHLVDSQSCKEPSTAKIGTALNRYWVKIKKTDIGLILTTHNISGVVDQFLVISINQNVYVDEILLKRIKKKF